MIQTHQEISSITIANTMPTESFAHIWRLNASVSRQKAVVKATVLPISDVRPMICAKIPDLWRLATTQATSTVDCIGSRLFRSRSFYCGDLGDDTHPDMEVTPIAVERDRAKYQIK